MTYPPAFSPRPLLLKVPNVGGLDDDVDAALAAAAVVPVRTDLVVVLRRFGSAAARRLVTYATLDRQAPGRRAVGRGSGFVLGRTEAQQR